MNLLLILSLSSFLISLIAVGTIKKLFSQQLLDIPNERSSHIQPTPRGGGLGFIIAFALTSVLAAFLNTPLTLHLNWWLMLIPLTIIGIIDDRQGVPALVRYCVQLSVGIIAVFYYAPFPFPGVNNFGTPGQIIGIILTVLGITALINFYNFMDGLDGLAAGCSLIQLSFFAIFFQEPLLLFLVAALGGFLYWNWSPAKIFMGDAGSTFLGAIVGITLLSHGNNSTQAWLAVPIILPFVGDAIYTILCRVRDRENIFEAHRRHLYQRLQKSGWSHPRVSGTYMSVTLLVGMAISFLGDLGSLLGVATMILGIIVGEIYLKQTPTPEN